MKTEKTEKKTDTEFLMDYLWFVEAYHAPLEPWQWCGTPKNKMKYHFMSRWGLYEYEDKLNEQFLKDIIKEKKQKIRIMEKDLKGGRQMFHPHTRKYLSRGIKTLKNDIWSLHRILKTENGIEENKEELLLLEIDRRAESIKLKLGDKMPEFFRIKKRLGELEMDVDEVEYEIENTDENTKEHRVLLLKEKKLMEEENRLNLKIRNMGDEKRKFSFYPI